MALALLATAIIYSSVAVYMLYLMFYLKLPLKRVGYWLTTPNDFLKWWIS